MTTSRSTLKKFARLIDEIENLAVLMLADDIDFAAIQLEEIAVDLMWLYRQLVDDEA